MEGLQDFIVTTNTRKIAYLSKRYRIVRGSAGASKTFSILSIIINHCSSTPNRKCIIISKHLAKMKLGCIADFIKLLKIFGIYDSNRWNSTSALYTFPNDSTVKFVGTADDPTSGKGVRSDVLYAVEANTIEYEAFRQFASRSNIIYLCYNPDRISWIEKELMQDKDSELLVVTYDGNEALGDAERNELDSYYGRAFDDYGNVKSEYWHNMWKIYCKGELGSFVGAIFTNVVTGDFDDSLPSVYGYDMGYNDEDALVKVAVDKKAMKIYIKEIIYQNGLSNADITKLVKQKVGNQVVVCDSAAAKTIADFKQAGIRAVSCHKNRIVDDIKDMQGYTIVITPDSPHALEEFQNWRWKDSLGKSIPEDGMVHCADSGRYGFVYLTTPAPRKSSVIITQ